MPEFYRISFDEDELEFLRRACALQSEHEDRRLDEAAAAGSLEDLAKREAAADDMQLIRGTVAIFKPGQTILITKEDLLLMKKCLKGREGGPVKSAVKKIDGALRPPLSGAGRR